MPFIQQHEDGRWVRKTDVTLRQLKSDHSPSLLLPLTQQFRTATRFEIAESFRYTTRAEADWANQPAVEDGEVFEMTAGETTDLASVPPVLWGLIASYGGHTMPALLHDTQCGAAREAAREDKRRGRAIRRSADARFRRTLRDESDAGVVTQWLMWSVVRTFSTPLVAILVVLTALVTWACVASRFVPVPGLAHYALLPVLMGVVVAAAVSSPEAPLTDADPDNPEERFLAALGDYLHAAVIVTIALPAILPMATLTVLTRFLLLLADVLGFVAEWTVIGFERVAQWARERDAYASRARTPQPVPAE